MPVSNGKGPAYISSHSADVILSDIRPIKLKIEGLTCINVFLDEFLYGILSAARSLTTDKLRAGLLSVLPTALGKEALLEAEVELRAYWDRTKHSKNGAVDDDSNTFSLQWAFELLRLKCEAYSTLNESDGDKSAETRLNERLAGTGQPPKPSLVAPAALYLTAILEAMCEHVLSNVGRVASRDSSRTYASVQDVFVALCEDETIYNLFKSMDVYEQIEQLSQAPKPRRSKSFSRNDKNISRTSSTNHDNSSGKDSPTPATNRLSSDGMTPGSNRSSFDRAKSMKKLINGRSSSSNEGASNGHKRSESALSDEPKQNWATHGSFDPEEQASLQEFDDLMKSDATMKVSLTPDRLKTMEVYKQEKERGSRPKPTPLLTSDPEPSTSSVPPRAASRRPSAPNVESIVEDEEEPLSTKPTHRIRQASVVSPPPKIISTTSTRSRSHSAAASSAQRKPSKTSFADSSPAPMMQTREFRAPQGFDGPGHPQKTRKVQRARESLDLDAVMAGSDDEDIEVVSPSKSFMSTTPSNASKVSARTRELMDFLNEGPPPTSTKGVSNRAPTNGSAPPVSKAGRELMDFLAQGPPDYGPPPSSMDSGSVKSKGSGRLQRMISKLKLNDDKGGRNGQQSPDDFRKTPVATSYSRPPLALKASNGSLSALANRPIPPRPPQPQMISPPSSPIRDTVELPTVTSPASPSPRPRQPSIGQSSSSRKAPVWDQETSLPSTLASTQPNLAVIEKVVQQSAVTRSLPSRPTAENVRKEHDLEDTKPLAPLPKASPTSIASTVIGEKPSVRVVAETKKPAAQLSPIQTPQTDRKTLTPEASSPSPAASSPAANGISIVDALDMKRLLMKATTPEECRLIMDIFLHKAGIPVEPTECDVPYPSPSPSDATETRPSTADTALEIALVELFLGGEPSHEPAPRKKRYTTKKVRVDTQTANNLQRPLISATNGNAIHSPPTISVVSDEIA